MVFSQLDQTITSHSAEVCAVCAAANADGGECTLLSARCSSFFFFIITEGNNGGKARKTQTTTLLKARFQVRTWDVAR